MIEGGAIDDVDILIGAHIQPAANVPTGSITPAMYHAAQYMMTAHFHGVQAHGSRPHLGVNAIEAGVWPCRRSPWCTSTRICPSV